MLETAAESITAGARREPDIAVASRRSSATGAISMTSTVFAVLTGLVLYAGWSVRDEGYLTAEVGAGYTLGLAGVAAMAALLLYPLRKRLRFMNQAGAMRHWLQIHMLLGVIGPVLIMFHCSFRVGSLNSAVALVSMLIVAASGIVGRFLYARLHRGLYGRRLRLRELLDTLTENDAHIRDAPLPEELSATLTDLTTVACETPHSLLHGVARWARLSLETRRLQLRLLFRARRSDATSRTRLLPLHLATVRQVAGFTVYERMFALWHVVHVPLFWMMLVAIGIHVVAVHMY